MYPPPGTPKGSWEDEFPASHWWDMWDDSLEGSHMFEKCTYHIPAVSQNLSQTVRFIFLEAEM